VACAPPSVRGCNPGGPRCVLRGLRIEQRPSEPQRKEPRMAQIQHTPTPPSLEEAITTLFCEIDDTYRILNPRADLYKAIKKLSNSEVLTLALFQQLRGVESERSFLRDAQCFFVHLFPGVAGLAPSSFHRRVGLTPVGGHTRVSDVNADEGSPKGAGSNTTLYTRVQSRGRSPSSLRYRQTCFPDSQGAWRLGQRS
jgi:hypothetical protein